MKKDEIINLFAQGFEMAVQGGPLCEEAMMGVCFIIENLQVRQESAEENKEDLVKTHGPLAGQIISTVKDLCLESFLGANPRLVEGMYKCYLQCDQENYPKGNSSRERARTQSV